MKDERCAECKKIIAESFGEIAYKCTRCGLEPLCEQCHGLNKCFMMGNKRDE